AVNVHKGHGKKLSDKERKHLQSIGACFKCKQPGHTAKFCPNKGNSQNPAQLMQVIQNLQRQVAQLQQTYPAMPLMPSHKVSRSPINLHNVETMTGEGTTSYSVAPGNGMRQ